MRSTRWLWGGFGVLMLGVAACGTTTTSPDKVYPGSVGGPAGLTTLAAGAVGDFAAAYGGYGGDLSNEGIILNSGLLADEFINTDYFDTHLAIDQRNAVAENSSNESVYRNLHKARISAERAAAAYLQLDSAGAVGHLHSLNLAGFVYLTFAEDYCGAVPFSSVNDKGVLSYGSSQTTLQMLTAAQAKFDSVIAFGATDDSTQAQVWAAQVGKGRALVNLKQYAQAATAVRTVPTEFGDSVGYSQNTDRERNGVFHFNWVEQRWSAADLEGENGLDFLSSGDPRTTADSTQFGLDGFTMVYAEDRYKRYESSIPLATGVEARLIEAEAALNNAGTLRTKLNAARRQWNVGRVAAATLPDLSAGQIPGAHDARVDLLFRERAFHLWLSGHRLGDLRRLVRDYGRDAESVYPTGDYFKGGTYGTAIVFPVSSDEQNNPNYHPGDCQTDTP